MSLNTASPLLLQKPFWTLLSHRRWGERPQPSQVQFWTQSCLSPTSHLSSFPADTISVLHHSEQIPGLTPLRCALLSLESTQSPSSWRRIWAQLPPLHEPCLFWEVVGVNAPWGTTWSSICEQEDGFLRHCPCQVSTVSSDDAPCTSGSFPRACPLTNKHHSRVSCRHPKHKVLQEKHIWIQESPALIY